MDVSSLSLREKVMQTVVLRIQRDAFVPEPVGAAFFFGEIITEESDLGLDQARAVLQAYADNAKVPILLVSDFENGCGSDRMEYIKATKNDEFWQHIDEVNGKEARSDG